MEFKPELLDSNMEFKPDVNALLKYIPEHRKIYFKMLSEKKQKEKTPVSKHVIIKLNKFLLSNDVKDLKDMTFRYIYNYIHDKECDINRFPVACADHGYTLDELSKLKKQVEKTPLCIINEIINEIVNRT